MALRHSPRPRRRRQPCSRRVAGDRGLRPIRARRPALDRALQAVAARSGRRLVADFDRKPSGGPRDAGRRWHRADHTLRTAPRRYGQRLAGQLRPVAGVAPQPGGVWEASGQASLPAGRTVGQTLPVCQEPPGLSERSSNSVIALTRSNGPSDITRGSIVRLASVRLYVLVDGRPRPTSSSGLWFR